MRAQIMGILNNTPDSFFDGGVYNNKEQLTAQIKRLFNDGADIIDIGGYSSRPGAPDVTEEQEWSRVKNALLLTKEINSDAVISVDTFRSTIAQRALAEFGVNTINDISAGEGDPKMFSVIKEYQPRYCIMHMQGSPQNMQLNPSYENCTLEIMQYFAKKIEELHSLGICNLILDPGFGFGKTVDHNYQLLNNLNKFNVFELPVLVGISRKSMLYRLLGTSPQEALNATSSANTIALMKGASILRVHDVREAKECINIVEKLTQS